MKSDQLAAGLFAFSVAAVAFALGVAAQRKEFFPIPQFDEAMVVAQSLLNMSEDKLPWYYAPTTQT